MANDLPYQRSSGDYYFPLQQQLQEGAGNIMLRGDVRNEGLIDVVIGVIRDLTGIDLHDLFTTVDGWIQSGIDTLQRIVGQILDIFNGIVITPINAFIQGVKDWFHGIFAPGKGGFAEAQKQAIDLNSQEVQQAMADAAEAAGVAAAAESQAIIADQKIADLTPVIGSKANVDEVPKNVPGWNSLNPLEDVSFPRTDLVQIPWRIRGWTKDDGGSDYHRHSIWEETTEIVWADPVYSQPAGRIDWVYINCTRKRIYNTITFAVGPRPSNPGWFIVALYKMDTTNDVPNGNLTRIWSDPLDKAPSFPIGSSDVTIEFPDIQAQPGEWYAIAVQQGGGTVRPLFSKKTAAISAKAGQHPTRLSMTRVGANGVFDANYTVGQLDIASLDIPWAALGQKAGVAPASWVDLFDRGANVDTLGPNWGTTGVGIVIRNNMARSRQVSYAWNDSRENYSTAAYANPTVTRSQSVGAKTALDWVRADQNDAIRYKPYNSMIWLRANADLSRGVALMIYKDKLEVRGFNAQYPRSTNPAYIGGIELKVVAHPDTRNAWFYLHATGTAYTVYKNGETAVEGVLTWSDSETNPQFATDRNDKYGGMSMYCYSNGNLIPGLHGQFYSIEFDEWKLRDLVV